MPARVPIYRSGQPDVALDAYRHLLSQGLPPTPTAFRAVLDVHMGRGAWEEADAVLGDMAKGGSTALDAEVRTHMCKGCWWEEGVGLRLLCCAARATCLRVGCYCIATTDLLLSCVA